MTEKSLQELAAVSDHFSGRREAIMKAWREASAADPEQTTVDTLSRNEFYDHMPEILSAFEEALRARPGSTRESDAEDLQARGEARHGLHRWQQGFRLREILREWGQLHLCLFDELCAFRKLHPGTATETFLLASRELIRLVNGAINESTSQYVRLEKQAAASRARDLELALEQFADVERQRGELIRQAVHDLGGNVQAVSHAAAILSAESLPAPERAEIAAVVQRGVNSLRVMLVDLMSLARLEAGQEHRKIAPLDAAELLDALCKVSSGLTAGRPLTLEVDGPRPLPVEGDGEKIHRIAQNLVLNALKYTDRGSVNVSWGEEGSAKWWFSVRDTGPGILAGPGAPMLEGMKQATDSARGANDQSISAGGTSAPILEQPASGPSLPTSQTPGEGIGLSIVKRLCDLLDASLEVASTSGVGTTFRVVLPRRYEGKVA